MTTSAETAAFLDAVERFAERRFTHRDEIAHLMEHAQAVPGGTLFDELIFHAKFVTNATALLRRTGGESGGAQQLSTELRNELSRVTSLLRTILHGAPEDIRQRFEDEFLTPSMDRLSGLFALLRELSWVKNYTIDKQGG